MQGIATTHQQSMTSSTAAGETGNSSYPSEDSRFSASAKPSGESHYRSRAGHAICTVPTFIGGAGRRGCLKGLSRPGQGEGRGRVGRRLGRCRDRLGASVEIADA